jgi:hypothetical protein
MSGVVWARCQLIPQSLWSWALVGLRSACIGLYWPSLAVVGHWWPSFGLWGLKRVVWMWWVSKCVDGVLRRVAGSRNTWLRVGGSTIEKKHEKLERKHEKLKKKHTYGPNNASGVVWARCCCRHAPKPHCAFKT